MPKVKKIAVVFVLLSLFSLALSAQFAEVGLNEPPGLHWEKIETPHFIILFPENLTEEAQTVANRAESIYCALIKTSAGTPKRLTL
ncbi:MAG: hypothetical protein MUP98_08010, partial [Candidatus Aminicenantes bacterium]|nr:hypothetical protein [Candidatus Aminicenantes bacterium]